MIKRLLWLVLALTLLVALVAGCASESSDTAAPDATESSSSDGDAASDTGSDAAEPEGPAALTAETDGEKEALLLAESEEGRTWGSGDWQNGTPVTGDPFLAGYGVLVHDGTTQYQVTVIGGEVVGLLAKTGSPRYVEAPFANYNPTIEPASAQQTEAFETAKAEVAQVNPAATQGGIESYHIFYPVDSAGMFPHVAIFASPTLSDSPWAMGGSFGWQ